MLYDIPLRQKKIIMAAVMTGLFLVALDQTIIATALGSITADFQSFSSLGWVVTIYLLTMTITVPIAGKLSDIFGRRKLLLVGAAMFIIASFLSGSAGSIEQLIVWRGLQGIGAGVLTANVFTIVGDLFSPRERGKWQGVIAASFGAASIVGPLLGGYLSDPHLIFGLTTTWRWAFWINVPIGLISLCIIAKYCPAIKRRKDPVIDYLGAGILALILATIIVAVDNTSEIFSGLLEYTGLSLTMLRYIFGIIILASLALFIRVERRSKEPIIPLRFFKNRTFTTIMFFAFFNGAAFLGAILYLTQFNQQVFGASASEAGLMLIPLIIGLGISATGGGQLVSRTGRYKAPLVIGSVIATLSLAALTTLGPQSTYTHEMIMIIGAGFGLGFGLPIISVAVQNEFTRRDLGAATATSQLFRSLGSTIGVAVLGSILTTGIATSVSNLRTDTYIKTIQNQPSIQQFASDLDTDGILALNSQASQQQIVQQLKASSNNNDPSSVQLQADLYAQQQAFEGKVAGVFSTHLRTVFVVAAIFMLLAAIATLFIIEKPLKDYPGDTHSNASAGVK